MVFIYLEKMNSNLAVGRIGRLRPMPQTNVRRVDTHYALSRPRFENCTPHCVFF